MTTTIVRRFQFCCGHRLPEHEGRCASMHGHNYEVHFHATCETLDGMGRVIDFSVLKSQLGGWIEENWDHAFLCARNDQPLREALTKVPGQRVYLLDDNPTAENLARYLLNVVAPEQLGGTGVTIFKVVLWETENCRAEVSL